MSKKVLLSESINPIGMEILENAGFDIVISKSTGEKDMIDAIQDADAVLVRSSALNASIIEAGKQLKVIARHGTGIDNVDVEAATKQGVLVAKVDGANSYSVAEYAMTAILSLTRRIAKSDAMFKSKEICQEGASLPGLAVKYDLNGSEVRGKNLGIIGFGKIGKITADLAQAFGAKVSVYDPFVKAVDPSITLCEEVDTIYETSDFIVVVVPLTDATHNLIDKNSIAKMKDSVILVNAGRGGVVNEEDLAEALHAGTVKAAALDVFEVEPPKKDNPILSAPNVLLTAHIAGTTKEASNGLSEGAAQAIVDYFNGKRPEFTVNDVEVLS